MNPVPIYECPLGKNVDCSPMEGTCYSSCCTVRKSANPYFKKNKEKKI